MPQVEFGGVLLLFQILISGAASPAAPVLSVLRKLHIAVGAGRRTFRTAGDLIQLGNDINQGQSGLRRQLAFGGGPTPSKADVLYPPSSELPALVESMGGFLHEDLSHWPAPDLAAFVCEYAVRVHPFFDGNGRWARLLAVEAGLRAGSIWSGACAALFNKQRISSAASRLRYANVPSMEQVLNESRRFSTSLGVRLAQSGILADAERFWALALRFASSKPEAMAVVLECLANPESDAEALARGFGWSAKKSSGFAEAYGKRLDDFRCLIPSAQAEIAEIISVL
jgi:hypothetical protein